MKGTIIYQCRLCTTEITIREVLDKIYCPTCNKDIELIPTSKEYLEQFFGS